MFDICNQKELLNELKCRQCSKVLSVLPVHHSTATGNICGRCIDKTAKGNLEQAVAYEAIAKHLTFPCSNYEHGCEAKLECDEVVQHEQQCRYVITECPFNLDLPRASIKCDWKGLEENLLEHMQDKHKEFLEVASPNFVLHVDVSYFKIFFTVIDDVTFLVITRYLKTLNKLYCIVVCLNKPPKHRNYNYLLELTRKSCSIILHKPETEAFSNMQEIVNNQKKMLVADIATINAKLDGPKEKILCKINIRKKLASTETPSFEPPRNEIEMDVSKLGDGSKSADFWDEFECPVCNEYMKPPIFICPTGHSICNSCKDKVKVCPSCRVMIQDTRNFTLEKLAANLKYSCKFKNNGCTTVLSHGEIEMHQLECLHAYGRCPLSVLKLCDVKEDVINLIGHLREKHLSCMVHTGLRYSRDIVEDVSSSYWVTVFEDEVFMICCRHSGTADSVKMNVLHVGMSRNKPKYKYEFEFCDQTGNGLKFIISQLCEAFPSHQSAVFEKCLTLPHDLLESFMFTEVAPKMFFKFHLQRL